MFFLGRLASWWRNRQRAIFVYHDGTGQRRADPLRIVKALEGACPEYVALVQDAARNTAAIPIGPLRVDADTKKRTAAEKLAQAAYTAFDLKPLHESGGVTDGEALRTLVEFLVFMEDLAEEASHFTS